MSRLGAHTYAELVERGKPGIDATEPVTSSIIKSIKEAEAAIADKEAAYRKVGGKDVDLEGLEAPEPEDVHWAPSARGIGQDNAAQGRGLGSWNIGLQDFQPLPNAWPRGGRPPRRFPPDRGNRSNTQASPREPA